MTARHGKQYAGVRFQRLLAEHGMAGGRSRRGDCDNNAVVANFFARLKAECMDRKTSRSRTKARADVFGDIEQFYNSRRRHSTPGWLSTLAYEKRAALAWWMCPKPGAYHFATCFAREQLR